MKLTMPRIRSISYRIAFEVIAQRLCWPDQGALCPVFADSDLRFREAALSTSCEWGSKENEFSFYPERDKKRWCCWEPSLAPMWLVFQPGTMVMPLWPDRKGTLNVHVDQTKYCCFRNHGGVILSLWSRYSLCFISVFLRTAKKALGQTVCGRNYSFWLISGTAVTIWQPLSFRNKRRPRKKGDRWPLYHRFGAMGLAI